MPEYDGRVVNVHTCNKSWTMDFTDYRPCALWIDDDGNIKHSECSHLQKPDAVEEVRLAFYAQKLGEHVKRLWDDASREMDRLEKGREVVVVRGRKVPHGTTGVLFWLDTEGRRFTHHGPKTYRCGIKTTAGETIWIDQANVEVAHPDNYFLTSEKEIRQKAWGQVLRDASLPMDYCSYEEWNAIRAEKERSAA